MDGTSAPGLEHGNRSNEKEADRTDGKNLQEHATTSTARLANRLDCGLADGGSAVTAVTENDEGGSKSYQLPRTIRFFRIFRGFVSEATQDWQPRIFWKAGVYRREPAEIENRAAV